MYQLTKEDIGALRKADDSVSFYFNAAESEDGMGTIVARKRRGDEFGGFTAERTIPVRCSTTIYNEKEDYTTSGRQVLESAHWGVMSPSVNGEWHTFADIIKPGDEIVAHWTLNNNNDHLRRAGLTCDEFELVVNRAASTASGRGKRYTFKVGHVIQPPGSIFRNASYHPAATAGES